MTNATDDLTAAEAAPWWWSAPDGWHRPSTYWFWHGIPTEQEITTQVAEMAAAGMGGFQVQARMSLPLNDYLSAEYLTALRYAVDAAAHHRLIVGFYDDYNWQSGHAAGRAVDGHDHLRERHLFWTTAAVAEPETLVISGIRSSSDILGVAGLAWHFEDSRIRWDDWEVVDAVLETPAGELRNVTGQIEIGACSDDGAQFTYTGEETGRLTVFAGARCASSRLINAMDRTAVERFVEVGYNPVVEALGQHVGTTLRYVFFDQPHTNFYRWDQHTGSIRNGIPYSASLLAYLREEWPQLAATLLPVIEGSDDAARALRARFFERYSRWAQDTYLGTVRSWTQRHGLLLSGHEVLAHVGGWSLATAFDKWDLRLNFGLDYFGIDSYRDLTGCDAQDSLPQLSAKLADSVARSHGRSGAMLEQYYGAAQAGTGFYTGHWGLTLSELRKQAIRHHLLGMRQLVFHGFYQTDGFDNDTTMFANPRFDFPPGINFEPWFTEYHKTFAVESGRLSHFLDDLIPQCEVAVLYPLRSTWADGQSAPHAAEVGRWCEWLAQHGYTYHLIDESDLLAADPLASGLTLGTRTYRALVLPGVTTLRSASTADQVRRLAESGVVVILTGATPTVYQEGGSPDRQWTTIPNVFRLGAPGGHEAAELLGPAGAELGLRPAADVEGVWWVGGQTTTDVPGLVLFNDGAVPVTVPLIGADAFMCWNPETGEHRVNLSGAVHLVESGLVLVTAATGADSFLTGGVLPEDGVEVVHAPWRLEFVPLGGGAVRRRDVVDVGVGLEHQGFDETAGVATYSTEVTLDAPVSLRLDIDAVVGSVRVLVNGVDVGRRGWEPFTFHIPGELTGVGSNTVDIVVSGTAANHYYAGTGMRTSPEAAGLLSPPRFTSGRPA